MAGYNEGDPGRYERHAQDPSIIPSSGESVDQPPHQEYNGQPYVPRWADDDDGFPSQQGDEGLQYSAHSPYSFQTQRTRRLPGPYNSRGGVDTDVRYEDRNSPRSFGTEPFQQMGAYLMSDVGYAPYSSSPLQNGPQIMGPDSTGGDTEANWYQGGRSSTTNYEAPSYQPLMFPGVSTYLPQPDFSTETRFRMISHSLDSNNTTAYVASQPTSDGLDRIETAGAPMDLRQLPYNRPLGSTNYLAPEPRQVHIDSAYAEPWSGFQPTDANQEPPYHGEQPMIGRHETSDTTRSMFSGGIDHSSHPTTEGVTTPLSSMGINNNYMGDSTVTERARNHQRLEAGYQARGAVPYRMVPTDPQLNPFQLNVERSETPRIGSRPAFEAYALSEPGPHLAPPMEKEPSSAYSCSTDASSPGPPPTDVPDMLCCEKAGCLVVFTGIHRRGNLGRHRRLCHKSGKLYVCEIDTCAKEFKRTDARVKHYRKYHPELASQYVPRPQARRPRRDTDIDLRNISSWT